MYHGIQRQPSITHPNKGLVSNFCSPFCWSDLLPGHLYQSHTMIQRDIWLLGNSYKYIWVYVSTCCVWLYLYSYHEFECMNVHLCQCHQYLFRDCLIVMVRYPSPWEKALLWNTIVLVTFICSVSSFVHMCVCVYACSLCACECMIRTYNSVCTHMSM